MLQPTGRARNKTARSVLRLLVESVVWVGVPKTNSWAGNHTMMWSSAREDVLVRRATPFGLGFRPARESPACVVRMAEKLRSAPW